jgi:hypothetical protein
MLIDLDMERIQSEFFTLDVMHVSVILNLYFIKPVECFGSCV